MIPKPFSLSSRKIVELLNSNLTSGLDEDDVIKILKGMD